MPRIISFIWLLLLFGCGPKEDLPVEIHLNKNWEFKSAEDSIWRAASVPGNVFSDLLGHQLIPHPFIGSNEDDVQWVSQSDWEYRTLFTLDRSILKRKNIRLHFEGLDTYASVYLNDSLILSTSNAFRQYSSNVKTILKATNKLRIHFKHPNSVEEVEKAKLPYTLPEGHRIFTRKAQFQYGWDWGPKLNTMGIWKPIKLQAYHEVKISDIYTNNLILFDSLASLNINLDFEGIVPEHLDYEVIINDSIHQQLKRISSNRTVLPVKINKPKLWWPHNIGEPYLYTLKVLIKDGTKLLDSTTTKLGLRTIDLVTEKDSIGESFYFKVNNVPVYAKGANYIPQHSFQDKVSKQHYEKLLSDVVDANMNMLRVWGGGIYENDIFYELCDEKGILVWQDFMFACAMYPGDEAFLNNVKEEAVDQVKRLRKHASIALWCGNNENSEGWHRWGWQTERSEAEKQAIWRDYLHVFDSILPQTVAQLTDTDYWESSPKYGRGNPKYEFEGDAHDWWIWHDAYPFEHLEEHVPRFMSEFGFQSFPSYDVIRYINQSDSIDIASEALKNHQKHHRGFELIKTYMERDFPVPEHSEDDVYISQLVQAFGITKGIEAHRRAKPRNMGTLYWQLNDCWPAISWSSIDFFGHWKALHYHAKKAFDNVLLSAIVSENDLAIYAINDARQDVQLNLNISLLDFNGKIIWSQPFNTIAAANSSDQILSKALDEFTFIPSVSVLKIASENRQWLHYFSKPKALNLALENIETQFKKTPDGFQIELSSPVLQKYVFLSTSVNGHFSDNYFDLLPNETYVIEFITKEESLGDLKIKTLNQIMN